MLFPINRLDSTAKLSLIMSVMSWTNVDLHQHPTHWLSFHRPELKRPCEPIQPWPISQLLQSDSPSKQQLIDRQWLIRNQWERKKKKKHPSKGEKEKKRVYPGWDMKWNGLGAHGLIQEISQSVPTIFSTQTNASAAHMHYRGGGL